MLSRVIATDCECPLSASAIALSLGASAVANEARDPYVRVAEIEIDPVQLEASKVAAKEIDSVRLEPGVLALYSVSERVRLPISPDPKRTCF